MAANQPQVKEPVLFRCVKHPNLKLRVQQGEQYLTVEGGQHVTKFKPDRFVTFKNGYYETADPFEIEAIYKCPNFTGKHENGNTEKKLIDIAKRPDPRQMELYRRLQSMDPTEALRRLTNQPVPELGQVTAGYQVQDPVAQTAQVQAAQQAQAQAAQQAQVAQQAQAQAAQQAQVAQQAQAQAAQQAQVAQQAQGQ